jgi:transposase
VNGYPNVPYAWIPINENIELPSSKSKSINVLGYINRNNDLHSYVVEGSVNSDVVIACFDDFVQNIKNQKIVIIDNSPTHTSKKFKNKVKEWADKNLYICYLPTYSPELNIIEILWRFIKYKWICIEAYQSYEKLKREIERVLKNVGTAYKINFKSVA